MLKRVSAMAHCSIIGNKIPQKREKKYFSQAVTIVPKLTMRLSLHCIALYYTVKQRNQIRTRPHLNMMIKVWRRNKAVHQKA